MRGGDFVTVGPTKAAGESVDFNAAPLMVRATRGAPARLPRAEWEQIRRLCTDSDGQPLLEEIKEKPAESPMSKSRES